MCLVATWQGKSDILVGRCHFALLFHLAFSTNTNMPFQQYITIQRERELVGLHNVIRYPLSYVLCTW